MHAVARLTLQRALPNIQASWVKMGPERAAALMHAGCNDMGEDLFLSSDLMLPLGSFGPGRQALELSCLLCGCCHYSNVLSVRALMVLVLVFRTD